MTDKINLAMVLPSSEEGVPTQVFFKTHNSLQEGLTDVKGFIESMPEEIQDNLFVIVGKRSIEEYFNFGQLAFLENQKNVH